MIHTTCIEPKIGGAIQIRRSYPHMYVGMFDNKQRHIPLRRIVLARVLGRDPVTVGCTCNNRMCINPDHLFDTSVAKVCTIKNNKMWAAQKASTSSGAQV